MSASRRPSNHHRPARNSTARHKQRPQAPQTADEWLLEGVQLEEASEKHFAGDAAKSARFLVRALDNYDLGLSSFPSSLDLAYNKARIQYKITQHPSLSSQFPQKLPNLLEIALKSHRYALSIEADNPELLFNTAQVLSDLASQQDANGNNSSKSMLDEAISLLFHCLELQEASLHQFRKELEKALRNESSDDTEWIQQDDGQLSPDQTAQYSGETQNQRWVSVQEETTEKTICDTLMTMFDTLATLCDYTTSAQDIYTLQSMGEQLAAHKIPPYIEVLDADDKVEVWISVAKFTASIQESCYRRGIVDRSAYDYSIRDAFARITLTDSPKIRRLYLCSYSDAQIDLVSAIYEDSSASLICWNRASKALELLTQAVEFSEPKDMLSLNVGRGDIEMLRYGLCSRQDLDENLRTDQSRFTLVGNAQKYYKGAAAFARELPGSASADEEQEAFVKEAVVACLIAKTDEALQKLYLTGFEVQRAQKVIKDMKDEMLLTQDMLSSTSGL